MINRPRPWMLALLSLLLCALRLPAYSLFTHEQLIDLTWKGAIRPLLMQHFPGVSEDELRVAHSYAYGGCAIQDLGYYPFGAKFFSDLTHYVRTGDFIASLLRNAHSANEYAFALGALSHYVGDTVGHEDAINPATALNFPKLAAKFGPTVTYDEDPHAHVRTEFGFDIEQLSKHRLAPGAYLRFIGLRVSRGLLERAFYETYSLRLREVLGSGSVTGRLSFRSYTWAVRSFLPRIAYAETVIHGKEFTAEASGEVLRVYEERLSQADFQSVWNQYRRKPGFKTYLTATLLRIVPKIGPLAEAKILIPDSQTNELYMRSVNRAVADFQGRLAELREDPARTEIADDRDLDTGRRIKPGEYVLTDRTYAKLLEVLAKHEGREVPPGLRTEVLSYFDDPGALQKSKLGPKQRLKIKELVAIMRAGQ